MTQNNGLLSNFIPKIGTTSLSLTPYCVVKCFLKLSNNLLYGPFWWLKDVIFKVDIALCLMYTTTQYIHQMCISSSKYPPSSLSYHHDHLGYHHSYLAKQSFYQISPFPQRLKIEKLIATKNGSNISVSFEFVEKERAFQPCTYISIWMMSMPNFGLKLVVQL